MKIFISQPMKDKTDEEILTERNYAINIIKEKYPDEEIEVLETFFQGIFHDVKVKPLFCLAKSLEFLSTADIAVFASGWENYRGCKIEHTCATEYGIETIEL